MGRRAEEARIAARALFVPVLVLVLVIECVRRAQDIELEYEGEYGTEGLTYATMGASRGCAGR